MELLYNWYKLFSQEGKKFGYLINGSKSWLMVNPGSTDTRSSRQGQVGVWRGGQNNNGRSTTPGSSHWIPGIQRPIMQWKSGGWRENIELLAEIVKSQPHAAYVAFTKGYKWKNPYFMRTTESFKDYMEPIDEVNNDIFLPVFCQTEPLPDELKLNESKSKLIRAPHKAARLAKINNAGQRQWCKLVAQRRSP